MCQRVEDLKEAGYSFTPQPQNKFRTKIDWLGRSHLQQLEIYIGIMYPSGIADLFHRWTTRRIS
jgi:hypothetical protein